VRVEAIPPARPTRRLGRWAATREHPVCRDNSSRLPNAFKVLLILQDRFLEIQNLWIHLSRGADTVPRGTVEMIKPFLGESGVQAFENIFSPMNEPTASEFYTAETL